MSHLSVELRPVESSVIDIGHAEQTQEPAQLGREDHGRSSPGSERVTLHVVQQVDQSAGRGTATLVGSVRSRERGAGSLWGLPPRAPTEPDLREPQGSNPLGPSGPELRLNWRTRETVSFCPAAISRPRPPLPTTLPLRRARLAGPLHGLSDPGGRASAGRPAVHRAEPTPRGSGRSGRDVAVVEPRDQRWRSRDPGAASRPGGPRPRLGRGVEAPRFETEVEAIRPCLRRDTPLGSEWWVNRTVTNLGLESSLHPRGNPRLTIGRQADG